MSNPLHVLVVEDSEDDLALLLRELRRNGYAPSALRVETPQAMEQALDSQEWDLILSDYSLPNFSAPDALELMKRKGKDLPFIILSGAVGEDRAVAALKAGAHDFIQKGTMPRLGPAIERELREAAGRRARQIAEAQVYDLYENAPCGYHSLDATGLFARINNTELKWLGYSRDELVGKKKFIDLLTPSSRDAFTQNFEQFKKNGAVRDLECSMLRKDGSILPVLVNATAIMDSSSNYMMSRSIVFDNTDHKRLEEQLRQSQKLDAIGKFAGGVAGDFNNMLSVILKHSQAALENMKEDDPMRRTLNLIHDTGKKAAGLTRLLLAFSRRQAIDTRVMDLYYVVAGMEAMLRRMLRENIVLETTLDSSGTRVNADPEQIEQIIMILVDNACDAMPAGGTITITTARVALDEAFCRAHPGVAPGEFAQLSVGDTGHGIMDSVMPFLFEPFFTTKDHGKGAGLGLSAVYGIVKQSGGCIEVSSEIGKGSTFKIYLPRVTDPVAPTLTNP